MLKFIVAIVIVVLAFIFLLDPVIKAGKHVGAMLKDMFDKDVGINDENPDI